jgi:hypothetical protein
MGVMEPIEDCFPILDLHEHQPALSEWTTFQSRLESNVKGIFQLLSDERIRAAFFVLGRNCPPRFYSRSNTKRLLHVIGAKGHRIDHLSRDYPVEIQVGQS